MSCMNKNRNSIDGFVPRRQGSQIGELHDTRQRPTATTKPTERTVHTGSNNSTERVGVARTNMVIGARNDISDSLRSIDDDSEELSKKSRKARRKDKVKKPKSKARRIIKWVSILLALAVVAIIGYVIFKAVFASNSIFKGNFFDIIQSQPLKKDANGRSNFLVFGTAEDDEGGTHGGANLTDSIMVVSVNQDKKDAYMVSLPRDLWVALEKTCSVGNQEKLNTVYFCGSDDGEDEAAGAASLSKKVGEITGLDIQYYVHLNFTAVVDAVDAVGGIDVTIPDYDPNSPGILDRNFDWKCGYRCYYVNYKDGEKVHLDGEHALALSRARNAAGGYGLPNGNFDREKNQQMIIKALREKALSAGTLTNLGAVTGLIDAMGKNLRTNIETKEIRTLMDVAAKIPSESIVSISLNADGESLVTTGNYLGRSIVRPVAGLLDYSEIRSYIRKQISSEAFVKEGATVVVLNGSGTAGVAQKVSDSLEDKGFTVGLPGNAPDGEYGKVTIYQLDSAKTATAAKLKELYGGELKTSRPPFSVVGDAAFVIVVGDASIAD